MKLRVLIVSNVRVVREGLTSILAQRDAVDVVSTADLPHAGDRSARLRPDVILFDAARRDSVEFVKDLVASAPHSKVVAFGVRETDEEILALAAAGTAGYVSEGAESESDPRSEVSVESRRRRHHRQPCRPPLDRYGPVAGHCHTLRAVRGRKPHGEALACRHARQIRHARATALRIGYTGYRARPDQLEQR